MVNLGPARGEELSAVKVDKEGEVLPRVAEMLAASSRPSGKEGARRQELIRVATLGDPAPLDGARGYG
ncbi:hypothetical protein ACMHYB_35705 [Sorangium sp. So ce1128]